MPIPINWSDPCAKAAELSRIYHLRLSSGSVKVVRTKSADSEREAHWYQGDMSLLRAEMQRAEDACREQQGLPPIRRRFAITAGSRRTGPCRF
jgi:hypothetical protein